MFWIIIGIMLLFVCCCLAFELPDNDIFEKFMIVVGCICLLVCIGLSNKSSSKIVNSVEPSVERHLYSEDAHGEVGTFIMKETLTEKDYYIKHSDVSFERAVSITMETSSADVCLENCIIEKRIYTYDRNFFKWAKVVERYYFVDKEEEE